MNEVANVAESGLIRPNNWVWITNIVSGASASTYNHSPSYLTANEWNMFTDRINAFRSYKSLLPFSFTAAVQGNEMLSSQIQEAIDAIREMHPPSQPPFLFENDCASYGGYSASFFIRLADSLNGIT